MAGTGSVKILGCGGSGGVPLVTGHWGNCDPSNPRNRRMRASIAVQIDDTCLVVDTGPDFRTQSLEFGIKKIDAILYTHAHSDHVNGVDELRYLKFVQKRMIDAYGDMETLSELQSRFAHLFTTSADGLYDPVVTPIAFNNDQYGKPVSIAGVAVTPFRQKHGVAGSSIGYRFGDFAYSTDVSGLDEVAFGALKGVKTWIVDCAQYASDFVLVHPNFDVVQAWNDRVGAERVILTHMTPRVDYSVMASELPLGYEPAYDGLSLEFNP